MAAESAVYNPSDTILLTLSRWAAPHQTTVLKSEKKTFFRRKNVISNYGHYSICPFMFKFDGLVMFKIEIFTLAYFLFEQSP